MEVFIGVGSNLDDRLKNIHAAIEYLQNVPGVKLIKVSSLIETEPQGYLAQGKFLNGVIKIETVLSPKELLSELKDIETKLGRQQTVKNGPRTIDLDILLYGEEIVDEPDLKIPHPRISEREFVLRPLFEIEPKTKGFIESFSAK